MRSSEGRGEVTGGVWGEVSFLIRQQSPLGWGYTNKARLRGLIQEIDFYQPDLV